MRVGWCRARTRPAIGEPKSAAAPAATGSAEAATEGPTAAETAAAGGEGSEAVRRLFWVALGALTFVLLLVGYGSGFWK